MIYIAWQVWSGFSGGFALLTPPRLAPTPTPIIIIHSHTPNFVLYFSQGYVLLHTCLVLLPARHCVAPTPPLLLQQYHSNISAKQMWSIAWQVSL